MIYSSITELIGKTPLLLINPKVHGLKNIDVYAKLEYYNPFGSVKDRVAFSMLEPILDDVAQGKKTVVEASSGNTAKALAVLCGIHETNFLTVTNRIKQPEVRMILQTLGAAVQELPGMSDCPDPLDPNDFTTVAANLAKADPDSYIYTDQYFNPRNIEAHYKTTGKEIADDLKKVDFYFGFLGTCGSSMGVGSYLKDHNFGTQVYGVVADPGHHVPGGRNMNELWEVGFFKKDFFTEIVSGTSHEAVDGMLELNRKVGMLCGPTSGLCYAAMIKKLRTIDADWKSSERGTTVFIACDRMEPYMSYVQKFKPEIFLRSTTIKPRVAQLRDEELHEASEISPEDLEKMRQENNKVIIIDTRGHFAYGLAHVPDSCNILDEVCASIVEEGRSFPMDSTIVFVCPTGTISKRFALFLKKQGYNAFSLQGGMQAWRDKKMPVDSLRSSGI